MSQKKSYFILILILFFGTILRFYLGSLDNKGDMMVHQDWAKNLYQQGIKGSYFYENWVYSPPTQPPLMMLSFWTSHYLFVHRYVLAKLHNFIHFPPADLLIWLDTYGEFVFLRLWAVLADIFAGIFIYFFVKRLFNKEYLALIATALYFLNPITLFETGIWGQNDTIGLLFYSTAILLLNNPKLFALSPILFLLGLMTKPTGLLLIPIFAFLYIKNLLSLKSKKRLFVVFFGILSCLILSFIIFLPFVDFNTASSDIINIFNQRISPSSKGVIRASNSAFNLYSMLFQIDKTPGSLKVLFLSLTNWGYLFYILLNIYSLFLLYHHKNKSKYFVVLSIIYIISQGSFLFMTGMLERYFFPAFLSSVLIMFFNFKKFGFLLIIQNLIWFINLFYAYYQRDLGFLRSLFSANNYLVIRIFSLLSILIFFLFLSKLNKTKD